MKPAFTAVAALLGLAGTSAAGGPPDPASLSMPPLPLSFTEKDRADGDTRYYFHKDGVSYEAAFADFQLCSQYADTVQLVAKPKNYVPLGSNILAPSVSGQLSLRVSETYGLVGGIIGAYVEGDIEVGALRLCLSYKGYKRYAVSRDAYGALTRGRDVIAKLAVAASGPAPQEGDVGP